MNRSVSLGGFEFDQQAPFNDNVRSKPFIENPTSKANGNRLLSFNKETRFFQFFKKQNLIYRLQQTRPSFSMESVTAINGDRRHFLDIVHARPLRAFVPSCEIY